MNVLGILLVLINVGAIAGPVAGVAIVYQNDPVEMVVPPEVEEVVTSVFEPQRVIELPKYVGSTYDAASRTASATFSFSNTLKFDLSINSVSANVECATHVITLGHAELREPVKVSEGATGTITVIFTWTQTAEDHFITTHTNAKSIDINLVNLGLDVSGIEIETPERISLTVPLQL